MRSGVGVGALAITLATHTAAAADLYVGPSSTYATIPDAITAASDGDTIWLEPGIYDNGYIDLQCKDLEIRSIEGIPDNTEVTRSVPFDVFKASAARSPCATSPSPATTSRSA